MIPLQNELARPYLTMLSRKFSEVVSPSAILSY